jgi:nitroreductase
MVMNDFMELLKSRRSIRKYEDKPVTDDVLNTLFEAVKWSQSWANTQCWEVINVKDRMLREKIQEAVVKNPATKVIVDAPVLLAICGKKNVSGYYSNAVTTKYGDWMLFDLGIATQSLCLAAHSLGLGTVVVGLYDHDKVTKVLNIPDEYSQVALIPLGYPAKDPSPPKRREVEEFLHVNTFGSKV